jgi:hypothetical protein
MADEKFLDALKTIRSELVTKRRDFADTVLNPRGAGSLSKKGELEKLIETQRDIEFLDRAIEDEQKLSGSNYNLDNLV